MSQVNPVEFYSNKWCWKAVLMTLLWSQYADSSLSFRTGHCMSYEKVFSQIKATLWFSPLRESRSEQFSGLHYQLNY